MVTAVELILALAIMNPMFDVADVVTAYKLGSHYGDMKRCGGFVLCIKNELDVIRPMSRSWLGAENLADKLSVGPRREKLENVVRPSRRCDSFHIIVC